MVAKEQQLSASGERSKSDGPFNLLSSPSVIDRLYTEGFTFDFFQAVRLLERLDVDRRPVGGDAPPQKEAVRFRAHLSLTFPPSSIYSLDRPTKDLPVPLMTVSFLGLTGPSGIMPRHYTELLLRLERDQKGPEKGSLRAWLDLFNHRLISLFYRAWTKYRMPILYERDESRLGQDLFSRSLLCLIGLGEPGLRNRLRITVPEKKDGHTRARILQRIPDLGLLYYAGFLAHRPRCAINLEQMLQDYFGVPVQVRQFHGQWLRLDPANQSRFELGGNTQLGFNLVAGARVWDTQSKFRIRLGPVGYADFCEFLPDRTPDEARKTFFLLCHLTRLYVGGELDFEVQVVLKAEDVPACQLSGDMAPRLGWNTWLVSGPVPNDAEDAVFEGDEPTRL